MDTKFDAALVASTLRKAVRANNMAQVMKVVKDLEEGSFEGNFWNCMNAFLEGSDSAVAEKQLLEKAEGIERRKIENEVESLAEVIIEDLDEAAVRVADRWSEIDDVYDSLHQVLEGSSLVIYYGEQKKVVRYLEPGDFVEEVTDFEGIRNGNYATLAYGILHDAVQEHFEKFFDIRKYALAEDENEDDD